MSDAWVTTKDGGVYYIIDAHEAPPESDEDEDQSETHAQAQKTMIFDAHPVRTTPYVADDFDLPWDQVGVWR